MADEDGEGEFDPEVIKAVILKVRVPCFAAPQLARCTHGPPPPAGVRDRVQRDHIGRR